MRAIDVPALFQKIFASGAAAENVTVVPDTGGATGRATMLGGFPPETFKAVGAGGVPPDGRDVNGLLKSITAWVQYLCAGGPVPYNQAFAAAIGGYPHGALVMTADLAGYLWFCTVDNNLSNPETGGAGWIRVKLGDYTQLGYVTEPELDAERQTRLQNDTIEANTRQAGDNALTASITDTQVALGVTQNNLVAHYASIVSMQFTRSGANGIKRVCDQFHIQWGQSTFPNSGGTTSSVYVAFNTSFDLDTVFVGINALDNHTANAGFAPITNAINYNKNGFTATLDNNTGGQGANAVTMDRNIVFSWFAFGFINVTVVPPLPNPTLSSS